MSAPVLRGSAAFSAAGFKIGLFGANCSSGLAATTIDGRWDGSWESNEKLAKVAEEGGLDFLLPIARWLGFGGRSQFQASVLETVSWASGLLARTERITIFATVHTAFSHPIVAAKQLVTTDHSSRGRLGLNVVAGWNKPEYEMFGLDLPNDHDLRYAFSQEWFDVVDRLWRSSAPFDYEGRFFRLKNVHGEPKPFGAQRPPVLNAGGSAQGQAFAQRNADVLFTSVHTPETEGEKIRQLKEAAATQFQRNRLGVFAPCYVVCRPTDTEANDFHQHYAVDYADEGAVELLMNLTVSNTKTLPVNTIRQMKIRFAGGHGGYPLIGSPDTVANEIARLASVGLDGIAVSFVDYLAEAPYFIGEVLPRLARAGVRGL